VPVLAATLTPSIAYCLIVPISASVPIFRYSKVLLAVSSDIGLSFITVSASVVSPVSESEIPPTILG